MADQVIIPKPLKYFLFSQIKNQKDIKGLSTKIGKITNIIIFIAKGNTTVKAKSDTGEDSVPLSDEETKLFLKRLRVKETTIEETKTFLVVLDLVNNNMHITQKKLDGTKNHYVI